jgi:WS/DGAT/MGAT family acyltransferase
VRAVRVLGRTAPGALGKLGSGVLHGQRPGSGLPVPRTRFNATVSSHRVFEARFHDFADVRRIKSLVRGATVNDVALAYIGGALRHYLIEHGELPETSLVAACPVSIRTPDQVGQGGNMISMMRVALRSDLADPVERLTAIAATTAVDRARRNAVGAANLVEVAELLPGALLGLGSRAQVLMARGPRTANTMITNVPGSQVPLYFAGAEMVRSTGNGPIMHGLGLIHLVNTYVGEFSCAITADRDQLPDPAFYAACLQRSFDELLAAAGPAPGHTTAPALTGRGT